MPAIENIAVSQETISNNGSPSDYQSHSVPSVDVLGLRFHCLNLRQTIDQLEIFIRERYPRKIFFNNAHTLSLCIEDEKLKAMINNADLNLADGMSIVWGARWLNLKLPGRVAGPDLTESLCARAAEKGYRIFLMGSSWENLARLSTVLKDRWPSIQVVGMHSPPMCDRFSDEETQNIANQLRQTNPDILFVGISCPKQERWISENIQTLNVPVCLGVGAAFDFLSGRIPRAPEFFRNAGLEWVHRLYCEPRRLWKRYLLGNFIFLFLLAKERVLRSLGLRKTPPIK